MARAVGAARSRALRAAWAGLAALLLAASHGAAASAESGPAVTPGAPTATPAEAAAWAALARGGAIVLLRHAETEPGVGDPPGFRLDDCATQRNLSAAGREQARRLGAAFAARRVRIDAVWSSAWCRCLETARLAFPAARVQVEPLANSFFDDRARAEAQTTGLRQALLRHAGPGTLVVVTHMVNIAAVTGRGVAMGELLVLQAGPGGLHVIGGLRP